MLVGEGWKAWDSRPKATVLFTKVFSSKRVKKNQKEKMERRLRPCSLGKANSNWVVCSFSVKLPSNNDVPLAGSLGYLYILQIGYPAPEWFSLLCLLFSGRVSFIFHRETCLPRIHSLLLCSCKWGLLCRVAWWAEPAAYSMMLCSYQRSASSYFTCFPQDSVSVYAIEFY